MNFFDFSDDVQDAVYAADNELSRLSAKTTVHRMKFPAAVKTAGFHLLTKGSSFVPGRNDIVIGAAPWSDYDLATLEDLAAHARSKSVRISIFDIDNLDFSEMVTLVPGIQRFKRTPVVVQYRDGKPVYFGEGNDAVWWLQQL